MKVRFQLLWIFACMGILFSTLFTHLFTPIASAKEQLFDQGEGYQNGAYDKQAIQPTFYNWSRKSRFIGPEKPKLKWAFETNHAFQSTPIIGADGVVYITSSTTATLFAINSDGTQKWQSGTPCLWSNSTPSISTKGMVYDGGNDGKLAGFHIIDGNWRWISENSSGGISTSQAIASDGTVYGIWGSQGSEGKLESYQPPSEKDLSSKNRIIQVKPEWTYSLGKFEKRIGGSPVIASDGTIYAPAHDGKLHAINPDGTRKWYYQAKGMQLSTPAIGKDGTVFFGTSTGEFYSIDSDGKLKWTLPFGTSYTSPSIDTNGTIYISNGILYAINSNGKIKWKTDYDQEEGYVSSTPVIGRDGTVYVRGLNGVAAYTSDGEKKWFFKGKEDNSIYDSAPAIGADGTIYFASGNTLYAIGDTRSPKNLVKLLSSQDQYTVERDNSKSIKLLAFYPNNKSEDVTKKATWTVRDQEIATVKNGKLTGKKTGSTTVFASYQGHTTFTKVNVIQPGDIQELLVNKQSFVLEKDKQDQLEVTALYSDGTTEDVTSLISWSTPRPAPFVTIENGILTGVKEDAEYVDITYKNQSVRISVEVFKKIPKMSFEADKTRLNLRLGEQGRIKLSFTKDGQNTPNYPYTYLKKIRGPIIISYGHMSNDEIIITARQKGTTILEFEISGNLLSIPITVK